MARACCRLKYQELYSLVRIASVPLVQGLIPLVQGLNPGRDKNFSLHNVLNGSRAHPALYKGVPGFFPGINLVGVC